MPAPGTKNIPDYVVVGLDQLAFQPGKGTHQQWRTGVRTGEPVGGVELLDATWPPAVREVPRQPFLMGTEHGHPEGPGGQDGRVHHGRPGHTGEYQWRVQRHRRDGVRRHAVAVFATDGQHRDTRGEPAHHASHRPGVLLTSLAGFIDAADATVAAARDFGRGEEVAVRTAWVEVGVYNAHP